MKSRLPILTHGKLRELLDYDPKTGVFTWVVSLSNRRIAGQRAGGLHPGMQRWRVAIFGQRYLASRLAWFWYHGVWPRGLIDHIDGNPTNDAIDNLRVATDQENCWNSAGKKKRTTPFKGAYRVHNPSENGLRWRSYIKVDGKTKSLGSFATAEEAHEAYMAAARRYFGEFARAK